MSHPAFANANLLRLALVYFLYFGQLGIMTPYLGVFLDGRGFNSVDIGKLIALITLTRIFGPNLWAAMADKTGQLLAILRIGSGLSVLAFLLLFGFDTFWGIALSLGLVMMFWTAVLPQLEVITLNSVSSDSGKYSKIRLWGSVGYIVCAVVLGKTLDIFSSESVIWASILVLSALTVATLFIQQPPYQSQQDVPGNIWHKLASPIFISFIVSAILLQVSFGPFYGFFALYMLDLGYSGQQTGWLIALGVMAEVLLFLVAGRLIARFGVKRILFICLLIATLRWGLLATYAANFAVLVLVQIMHAATFGLAHAASMQFLHRYFGLKYQSRGQAIYVSIAFGGGGALGNYVAGYLWQQGEGAFETFMFASAAAALASVVVLLMSGKEFESAKDVTAHE
ncbi:MFS transporter [Neptunicella sp. SCSIO 80796]|uniref:MFS transporter n=1 Tax=Neptunicella plasticusilytica TaxID=3117012 RepID=UPI003A4E3272